MLFIVGIAGIVFETLSDGAERPTLLIIFAAMVGLPVFLRLDGKSESKSYRKSEGEKDA